MHLGGGTYDACASGEYVFVSGSDSGVFIMPLQCASEFVDCNENGTPDDLEATTTRYFGIGGTSSGVGWSLGIQGPGGAGFNYEIQNMEPLPVGSPASDFVTTFIDSLMSLCSSFEVGTYFGSTIFYVTVPGDQGFELGVGPYGGAVECWLPPSSTCFFNPAIEEVVPDCNGNGIDDRVDLSNNPNWDWNGDGLLDICQQGQGISDIPSSLGDRFILDDAHPNPFNPQTTIAYELPTQVAVSLRVFDVSGRLVRVLVDDRFIEPGRNEAIWNGRDDAGRQVASGTYFYRLEAGEYSETKSMMLIK